MSNEANIIAFDDLADNISISFLKFAWDSLTAQQKYRIQVKYELAKKLQNNTIHKKRHVYRLIASQYGYTMERIEKIAKEKK